MGLCHNDGKVAGSESILISSLSRNCPTIEGLLVFLRLSPPIVAEEKSGKKASFCIVSYNSSNEFPGIIEYTTSLENTSSIVQKCLHLRFRVLIIIPNILMEVYWLSFSVYFAYTFWEGEGCETKKSRHCIFFSARSTLKCLKSIFFFLVLDRIPKLLLTLLDWFIFAAFVLAVEIAPVYLCLWPLAPRLEVREN